QRAQLMLVKVVAANLISALMLGVGLATRLSAFRDVRRRPVIYIKGLAVMWIGVPFVTMAVVAAVPMGPIAAELLLGMAVCPGAPFIPTATKQRGQAFSPVGENVLVLTSVLAPLLVPVWLTVLDRIYGFGVHFTPRDVFDGTVLKLLVPLGIGIAIRAAAPRV